MSYFSNTKPSKWEVTIYISGPIKIEEDIKFNSRKDFEYNEALYSNIRISKNHRSENSYVVILNSYSHDQEQARKWALIFLGMAIDVLSVQSNCPIELSLVNRREYDDEPKSETRIITRDEWINSFKESRLLKFTEPTFLKALGWYRKGLNSQDIFDSYLAYYNALEIVAGKYHTPNDLTKNGAKNQIWQCFKELWGDNPDSWKINYNKKDKWIDAFNQSRVDIAHGLINIDVKSIDEISQKLLVIKEVVYTFLVEWRQLKLNPEGKLTEEIRKKLEKENY